MVDILSRRTQVRLWGSSSRVLWRKRRFIVPPVQLLIVASDFKVGDEVFGLAYGGAYAEYIAVSVKTIVHKPKELSFETAAGLPEVWFTAIQALFLVANIKKGQTVLFHAGASGITSIVL